MIQLLLLLCNLTTNVSWAQSKSLEDRVKELEARVQKLETQLKAATPTQTAEVEPENFGCNLEIDGRKIRTTGSTADRARKRFDHQCSIVMNQPEIVCLKVKCLKNLPTE